MREKSFRLCMLVGTIALASVSIYYFVGYAELYIALANNGLQPGLMQSIKALWLAFACHVLLISLLYLLVAFRPHSVSREVIVILGLLQMVEAMLLFFFSGSQVAAASLAVAAVFVLLGALLWPKRLGKPTAGAVVAPVGGGFTPS
jgi:hypothetical protein